MKLKYYTLSFKRAAAASFTVKAKSEKSARRQAAKIASSYVTVKELK